MQISNIYNKVKCGNYMQYLHYSSFACFAVSGRQLYLLIINAYVIQSLIFRRRIWNVQISTVYNKVKCGNYMQYLYSSSFACSTGSGRQLYLFIINTYVIQSLIFRRRIWNMQIFTIYAKLECGNYMQYLQSSSLMRRV